jgi:hypothetical protein
MKTEEEIQKEAKRVRYERAKKEHKWNEAFLDGYYWALRWVQGKANSILTEETQKDTEC